MLTAGKFLPPNLPTTVLGKAVDNDQLFIDQFGPNCTRFKGFCHTEMLFKGAPDQVLSGEIRVRAKAYDTRIINYGEGTATLTERTGGMKSGILIAKMEIKPTTGRKTFAYSLPKLLIYARDRAQTDPLLPPNG